MLPVQNGAPTHGKQRRRVHQTELRADIRDPDSGPAEETQEAEAVCGQERPGLPQGVPAQNGQRPDCRVHQVARSYQPVLREKGKNVQQYLKPEPTTIQERIWMSVTGDPLKLPDSTVIIWFKNYPKSDHLLWWDSKHNKIRKIQHQFLKE